MTRRNNWRDAEERKMEDLTKNAWIKTGRKEKQVAKEENQLRGKKINIEQ